MINNYNFDFCGLDPEIKRLNSDVLKKIVIEKAGSISSPEELKRIERLVSLATAIVLQDINPYTSGCKKLTDKQVIEIGYEFDKIKARVEARVKQREDYLARNAHALMAMVSRLRSRQVDLADRESVGKVFNDYYQIMGYTVAYGKWKKGDEIVGPHPGLPNYEVHEVIKNSKGLQIVVLTPKGKGPDGISLPPIFCCRGSLPANSNSIIDDLNASIGQYSLPDSQPQIESALKSVTEKYGAAVMTGHSLGGAIAQAITAEYCDKINCFEKPLIQATYYYNAPGVGDEIAEQYEQKLQKLPPERKPKIFNYYHVSDLVFLAGGAHLKTDENYEFGTYTLSLTAMLAAHSFSQLISEIKPKKLDALPLSKRITRSFTEKLRRIIAKIGQPFFLAKVREHQRKKALAHELMELFKKQLFASNQVVGIDILSAREIDYHEIIEAEERQIMDALAIGQLV